MNWAVKNIPSLKSLPLTSVIGDDVGCASIAVPYAFRTNLGTSKWISSQQYDAPLNQAVMQDIYNQLE
jgi:hypothetical protein